VTSDYSQSNHANIRISQTTERGADDASTRPLSAGNAEVQIHCELSNFSRDSCPEYMALSYEWGIPLSEKPVIVNGFKMTVTANLQMALQHLIKEDDDIIIWIDAICINQTDDDKKASHIGHMRDIYTQSAETFVWLGMSDKTADASINVMDLLGKELRELNIVKEFSDLSRFSNTDQKLYNKKLAEIDATVAGQFKVWEQYAFLIMETYMRFRNLSYLNRVWIIQEFTVSSKLRLAWGHNTISSLHVHAFVMAVGKFCLHMVFSVQDKFAKGEPFDINLIPLFTKSGEPYSNMHSSLFGIRDRYRAAGFNSRESLLKLLARTSIPSLGTDIRSQCRDAQDRIFGLLGIASDRDTLALEPSYKKSASLIYQETARAIIAGGELDLLAYSQFPKSDPEMPSWVPDWRQQVHKPYGDHPWDTAFRATGERNFRAIAVSKELMLRGVCVDTISDFKTPWDFAMAGGYTRNFAPITPYLDDIQDLINESNSKNAEIYHNPLDRETAFYRIPIADQEMNSQGFVHRATEDSRVGYELLRKDLAAGEVLKETMRSEKSSYWNMMESLQHRRPFISEKGYVGLGPEHLTRGDVICLFLGAKFPYILRKDSSGNWSLVGEAYVHGIMYGEFMESNLEEDIFCIY